MLYLKALGCIILQILFYPSFQIPHKTTNGHLFQITWPIGVDGKDPVMRNLKILETREDKEKRERTTPNKQMVLGLRSVDQHMKQISQNIELQLYRQFRMWILLLVSIQQKALSSAKKRGKKEKDGTRSVRRR